MQRQLLKLGMALLAVALFVTCAKDEAVLTGSIAGIVSDARSGEPLSKVSVTLSPGGISTTTGSDGRYEYTGLEPGSYTVTAVCTDYIQNRKEVQVVVAQVTKADIQLTSAEPVLNLSSETLDFGHSTTTLAFDIINEGKNTLTWAVSEDIPWLTCVPISGTVPGGKQSVVVNVSREGLAKGNYSQTFAISSNGGSAVVKVSMQVAGVSVTISPEELDFGSVTSALNLSLTNTGSGTLFYTLESSNNWLIPGKVSGTFSKTDNVSVAINRQELGTGDYAGTLLFTFGEDQITVPVRMNIPSKTKPVVTFNEVGSVSYGGATAKGSVVSIGSSKVTRHGFCWATSAMPTIDSPGVCILGDCTTPRDFEYILSGLEADIKYYIRAYAENNEGLSYSNEITFTTGGLPGQATVETGSASNVKSISASVVGSVLNMGNVVTITQHGHVWATKTMPTTELKTKTELGMRQVTGSFTSQLTGLSANTTYYVRAYATNEKGTAYGDQISFTTSVGELTLTTAKATDITHEAATCGGTVTTSGGNTIVERGVCWSTVSNPVTGDNKVVATSDNATFTCRLKGLSPLTVYYARAYARTDIGTTFYGDNISFTTTHEITLADLSHVSVSEITVSKVSLSCSVVSNGHGKISDCGFCYHTSPNPTTGNNRVSYGESNSTFGRTVTDLAEDTRYYVRAYAINEAGTVYSEEVSFTTLAVTMPVLSNVTLGVVSNTKADFSATVTSIGNGTLTDAGFCYSTNTFPTINDGKLSCGRVTSLTKSATGLTPETRYYVRAYATNEKGTGYGPENSFTTTKQEVNPYTRLTIETSHGSTILDMAKVSGGTFKRGAQAESSSGENYDNNAYPDEKPVHQVAVGTFYMSKTPVTQYLWYVVTGGYPNISNTYGRGDTYPIYNVTYDHCLAFITKLNALTGKKFRMPTEAEWEFAARGGNNSEGTRWSGSGSCGSVAWYSGNSGSKTHPVAEKSPNELNIYDMNGNVWEWCSDWYANYSSASQTNPTGPASGSGRVIRGGGYSDVANDCRVSMRSFIVPTSGRPTLGLRLVME